MTVLAVFTLPGTLGQGTTGATVPAYAAKKKAISFKEGKKLIKRAGFGSELAFAKLRSKSKTKTVIVTYPGAKGMDIFTLRAKGKKVHVHTVIGTLDGGSFSKITYLKYKANKTVRR